MKTSVILAFGVLTFLALHAADLVIGPGTTVDLGDPDQPTSVGYDSLTVESGGTLNLLGQATLNVAGNILIRGSITAAPTGKAVSGAPGDSGANGPDNQPTGLNAGTGGTLGDRGEGWTQTAPPRLEFRSQGTVIVEGSIRLNPGFDGGDGGRGGSGGSGGSGMSAAGNPAGGGYGGQAGAGGAGGHGGLAGPTLRITADRIEFRAGSTISLDNLGQGGDGAGGGNGGNGGRGGDNTAEGNGAPGGGGGPAGGGGDGGQGGGGGTLWLAADTISIGGQISLKGGPGGDGGAAGAPGSGGNGGNGAGSFGVGGRGGDAGNPGQSTTRGGRGGSGGSGGTLYIRADELLIGAVVDLSGGDGGEGGAGQPAVKATGGQGGSPGGASGQDSGALDQGSNGDQGLPGRQYIYVNWSVTPSDPYWQMSGSLDCAGPFVDTDDQMVTRSGWRLCEGTCLSHSVNTQSTDPFSLQLDYRWLTPRGTLEFRLGNTLVHSIPAPATLNPHFSQAKVVLPPVSGSFLEEFSVCVISDGPAQVEVANLSLRPDPNASIPLVIAVAIPTPGSSIELSWPSTVGQSYQLQSTSSLAPPDWVNLGAPIPGTGSQHTAAVSPQAGVNAAFYRLIASSP